MLPFRLHLAFETWGIGKIGVTALICDLAGVECTPLFLDRSPSALSPLCFDVRLLLLLLRVLACKH
jgi:hypothetical protein